MVPTQPILPADVVCDRRPAVPGRLPSFALIVADTRIQRLKGAVTMRRSSQLTWAIGLGYLLGRRRRLRAAMMLGAAAAATRFVRLGGLAPGAGQHSLASGAAAKLGVAGRAAARTALERPVHRITQRLDEVAETVRGGVSSEGR
jgi:hypothetical protein